MTYLEIISDWLGLRQEEMIRKYDELGFRASGEWEKSLENSVEEQNGQFKANILGAHYTYYMEHGRRAGKFPPISVIRKWIDDKRIIPDQISKNSLAFLIARKIANEGTRIRPGIVSDVITQSKIDELYHNLGELAIQNVRSDVIKTFK